MRQNTQFSIPLLLPPARRGVFVVTAS